LPFGFVILKRKKQYFRVTEIAIITIKEHAKGYLTTGKKKQCAFF